MADAVPLLLSLSAGIVSRTGIVQTPFLANWFAAATWADAGDRERPAMRMITLDRTTPAFLVRTHCLASADECITCSYSR